MAFLEVGYAVRELREQKGLGLREVARRTGIARCHLADVENGTLSLVTFAPKLSRALGRGLIGPLRREHQLVEEALRKANAGRE